MNVFWTPRVLASEPCAEMRDVQIGTVTLVIRLVTGDIICRDFCNLTCGIGAEHGASLPGSRYNFFGDGNCFNSCRNS